MKYPLGPGRAHRSVLVASLLLSLAAPAAAVVIPFGAEASIDASFGGAYSVEIADLDRDGDQDTVGAAAGSGEVYWWENTAGDGSVWVAHAIDAAFPGAASVRVGDVDGDGHPDVVAAGITDGDIAWWRNDGTPATGSWTRFSIEVSFAGPRSVWLADLDHDGWLDVLAAAETAGEVAWWQNDGTPLDDTTDLGGGAFWPYRLIGAAAGAMSAATADIDGDGFLDVVAGAGTAGVVGWWRSDGDPTDGGWTPYVVDDAITIVRSVSAADLDRDGDLDLLATAGSGSVIAWWENDGDPTDNTTDLGGGNFWAERAIASSFGGAAAARAVDLDRDGDLDVLASAVTADVVEWWENDGDPTDDAADWTGHTVGLFNGAIDATAGDLDGDGDPDVAGAGSAVDDISWWRNESIHRSALFPAAADVATGDQPEGLVLADIDGDGHLDLVSGRNGTPHELSWWRSDGTPADGGWSEHPIGSPFAPPRGLAAGDLDGDGDRDVVAGISVFDVDLSWWENDGSPAVGTWTEHVLKTSAGSVSAVELADLDRDGDLDVVFAEAIGDRVGWFENDGSACAPACAWPEHAVDAAFGNARYLAVADLDRDGDLDLASHAPSDQLLVWWENDGDPAGDAAWTEHGIDSSSEVLCPVAAADVDGDGDADILSCPGSESSFRWFENDGTPGDDTSWAVQAQIVTGPATPQSVVALDFDGDGDLDLAVSVPESATVDELFFAWYENTAGDGSAWARHDVEAPVDVSRLAAGDLDGDGKPDLAGSKIAADVISWWPNRGGQFALATTDVSSAGILDGTSDDLLAIVASHRGRAGDREVELETFELLFEETAGDPLSTAEANAVIESLEVYLDDGSGSFDGADVQVALVSPLALTAGVETVFMSGNDVRLEPGVPRTYLVVVTTKAGASAETPDTFRVTHVTSASSTARDAVDLLPLELEHADDVSTAQITAQAGCFALTLSHTGGGSDPAPTPAQSVGCAAGEYVPGEVVSLQATPDAGWLVAGWTGTDADGSTATANAVTMPAAAHAVSVAYEFPDELVIDGEFLGGSQVREACLTIRAGDVPGVGTPGLETTIGASADVTFRAGASVVFYDGFRVFGNGTFVVEIATPTACLP